MAKFRANGEGTIHKRVRKCVDKNGKEYERIYWEARLTAGYKKAKDKNGKIILDKNGKPKMIQERINISGRTRAEVVEKMKEKQEELRHNKYVEPTSLTFGEYLDRWLKYKQNNVKLKRSTITGYRGYIENHIKPALGDYPVQRLTPLLIEQFYGDKLKAGLNPKTIHRFHAIIHNALKQATKEEIVKLNIADNVTLPKTQNKEIQILTEEEVKRLLEAAKSFGLKKDGTPTKNHNRSFYPALITEIYTGLRRAELLGLKWRYVDLEQGTIRIQETLMETNDGIYTDTPKTESSKRVISIPAPVVDVLKEHKKFNGTGEYVFTTNTGDRFYPHSFYRMFHKVLKLAGINRRVRPHDLRHTHATPCCWNLALIQKRCRSV